MTSQEQKDYLDTIREAIKACPPAIKNEALPAFAAITQELKRGDHIHSIQPGVGKKFVCSGCEDVFVLDAPKPRLTNAEIADAADAQYPPDTVDETGPAYSPEQDIRKTVWKLGARWYRDNV
jgi:hypothetical protein